MYAALLASFCAGAAVSYVSGRGAVRAAVAEVVADQRWQALVHAAGYAAHPEGVGARVAAGVERELAREARTTTEPGWNGGADTAPRFADGRYGLRVRVRE